MRRVEVLGYFFLYFGENGICGENGLVKKMMTNICYAMLESSKFGLFLLFVVYDR